MTRPSWTSESASLINPEIIIKRTHGLGNVICLLPVLDRLFEEGYDITVITQRSWLHTFSQIRPKYLWADQIEAPHHDLDTFTEHLCPEEHRTDEFGHLLGLGTPFPSPDLQIPTIWSKPFESFRNCVVFAPEGGHPSRNWPIQNAHDLVHQLDSENLVLTGLNPEPDMPCKQDLRGKLELHELFGLLSVAKTVITMDSGILHIAAGLRVPTVAVFGGVNPCFRIRSEQPVIALQSVMDCCPCNKNETCNAAFTCIKAIRPAVVVDAVKMAPKIHRRHIIQVDSNTDVIKLAG